MNIPVEIFQHYNSTWLAFMLSEPGLTSFAATQMQSHMGLLPQLERAWISIDSGLFLWDYIDGYVFVRVSMQLMLIQFERHDLSSYTEQPDVITGVTLVKPKPGVFIDEITYLLVLCTPLSMTLIGVSVSSVPGPNNRTRKEIKLYATDMSISTDVEMISVVGTHDGRIFMCGNQDGNLYELHYQEKEGWFGKRVQIVNHSVGSVQSLIPLLGSAKTEGDVTSLY